jgi:hypothetical protein
VLLTDLIMSVKEKNSLLKLSVYLQPKFAVETHLTKGLNSAWWQTSKVEKSLTDPVSTLKLTASKIDEDLSLFLKALMRNKT